MAYRLLKWALPVVFFSTWLDNASAATVMNNNDSGPDSLRALIAAASSGDTIDFDAGVTGTIALTTGVLNITKTLTITGPGSGVLTISGSNTSGIFVISAAGSLTISDLTLSDGSTNVFGGGGAILNEGVLDVSDCVLSDNTTAGEGGAIYNVAGTLVVSNTMFIDNAAERGGAVGISSGASATTISDSQFVGNTAIHFGGAMNISNDSLPVTIERTTFDGNSAGSGGGGVTSAADDLFLTDCTFKNNTTLDAGGAVVLNGSANTTIERTTFSNNSATLFGGAISGPSNSGNLTIRNSTVSNNTAGYGGGMVAWLTTTIVSSTFADNQATNLGHFGPAGNIYVALGPMTVENTLVAGGIPFNCYIDPTQATYASAGHNLDTGTTCQFDTTGDRTNANADLDVLANYGGPTFTRALLGASDAANAGNTATCPATDQRGVARPIGAACDIGAFEGQCGDGNPDPGEVCDDGNVVNGDGCDNNCTFTACGNDITSTGEQCDDGNTSNGDCCNSTCQYESIGSPCTGTTLCATTCNGAGSCAPAIRNTCRSALKSILVVKNLPGDSTKDKLIWKWVKGDTTMLADFGSPSTTTGYALCLYAGTSSAAIVNVPPGTSFWAPISTKGFKYKDSDRSVNAVGKVLLKQGAAGKAKALLKGKGVDLADLPAGPLALPLTAQLVNSTNAICYEGVYDTGDIIKNEPEKFKAKAQ